MEIWKDVAGYEDHYEVSDLGRIRSKDHYAACKGGHTRLCRGVLRKPQLNQNGYSFIVLCKEGKLKGFTIHQLVAHAFIPGFTLGTEINHKNGVRTDPRLTNIEVSNPSHNQLHAVRTGLRPKTGSSKYRNVSFIRNQKAKARWAACIKHAGKSSFGWKTFMTEIEAAEYVDILLDSIGDTQRLRNFPKSPKCPTTSP